MHLHSHIAERNKCWQKFVITNILNFALAANSIIQFDMWICGQWQFATTEWVPFFSKYFCVFIALWLVFLIWIFSLFLLVFFFVEFPNNFRLIKAHKSVWKFAYIVHNWIMRINANKFMVFNYYRWSCCCCLFLFTLCLIYVNCAAITCEMHTKCP